MPAPSLSSRPGERGQALVEYAVIVALIGICLVAILGLVSRATGNAYQRTVSTLGTQTGGQYGAGSTRGGGGGGGGGGGVILIGSGGGAVSAPDDRPPTDSAAADAASDSTAVPPPLDR